MILLISAIIALVLLVVAVCAPFVIMFAIAIVRHCWDYLTSKQYRVECRENSKKHLTMEERRARAIATAEASKCVDTK